MKHKLQKQIHPVLGHILHRMKQISHRIYEDKVTVYAAQASFFVVLSSVPFLSLLVSVISLFTSSDIQNIFYNYSFSEGTIAIIDALFINLPTAPKISLLSFSAIVTLWSASRGTSAIRRGIETVYISESSNNFLFQRFKGLISTLTLILLVVATIVLLLFGDFIGSLFVNIRVTDIILRWRTPFLMLFMSILFTTTYVSSAKRSQTMKSSVLAQLPGAFFASVGWIVFSYFYSLYINNFPNASYIYGSLAAICLIMLWLYFCMIILLLGAELNKFCSTWKHL